MIPSMQCFTYKFKRHFVVDTKKRLLDGLGRYDINYIEAGRILFVATYYSSGNKDRKIHSWILPTPTQRGYNIWIGNSLFKNLHKYLEKVDITDYKDVLDNHLNKQVRFYLKNHMLLNRKVLTEKIDPEYMRKEQDRKQEFKLEDRLPE